MLLRSSALAIAGLISIIRLEKLLAYDVVAFEEAEHNLAWLLSGDPKVMDIMDSRLGTSVDGSIGHTQIFRVSDHPHQQQCVTSQFVGISLPTAELSWRLRISCQIKEQSGNLSFFHVQLQ